MGTADSTCFDAACGRAREYVKTGNLPSAVLAVANARETLALRAFGPGGGEAPALAGAIFALASITKTFAGVSFARLVDRGLVDYADPVRQFIPEFSSHPWCAKVTVGDIFTHSTGLAGLEMTELAADPRWTVANAFETFFDAAFLYEPGTRMAYRTSTYQLLNEIAFRLTGKRMGVFLRDEVFAPCGLRDTGFSPADPARATPVVDHPMDTPEKLARFASLEMSGAGLWSTADDLIRYAQTLLVPGKLLTARTFDRMTTPQPSLPHVGDAGQSGRTWGWNKEPQAAFPRQAASGFYHGGATGTLLWIDPTRDFIFVFLANRWGCGNDQAFSCLNEFYA